MLRVIIESPFAGKTSEEAALNEEYLNAALAHSLSLGEAPFASHGIYTRKGVLDDTVPEERKKGIQAGFAWRDVAEKTVFYGDRGISSGMIMGLEHSIDQGIPVSFRSLGDEWRIDHPPEPGSFDERKALEWLRENPSVEWKDKNNHSWLNHMSMMFGGTNDDVFYWNYKLDGIERYIIRFCLVDKEMLYRVHGEAVDRRLREMDQEKTW
jgi:hypothetical protein